MHSSAWDVARQISRRSHLRGEDSIDSVSFLLRKRSKAAVVAVERVNNRLRLFKVLWASNSIERWPAPYSLMLSGIVARTKSSSTGRHDPQPSE